MITRSEAIGRGLVITCVVGAVGATVTSGVLRVGHVRQTIADLDAAPLRVNILWWGSLAFVACVAVLSGVIVGANALLSTGEWSPGRAVSLVSLPIAMLAGLLVVVVDRVGLVGGRATVPLAVGAGIGLVSAAFYLLHRGGEDDAVDAFHAASRAPRKAWGSR